MLVFLFDIWMAVAFILGATCSAIAGYFGMQVALMANARSATAAKDGVSKAFPIAFSAGGVMGMAVVGLAERVHHLPQELSGGEGQRVAIARALVNAPVIILADEPTGNLDTATGQEIMELLCELHDQGRTTVMVTHDPEMAAFTGRTIRLRDGRIESDSPNGEKVLPPGEGEVEHEPE